MNANEMRIRSFPGLLTMRVHANRSVDYAFANYIGYVPCSRADMAKLLRMYRAKVAEYERSRNVS